MLEVYESNADIQSFLDAVAHLKKIEESIPALQEEMSLTLELVDADEFRYDVTNETAPGLNDFRSFVTGYRQFHLKGDPTHFGYISGVILHDANSELLKDAILRVKGLFNDCLNSRPMSFELLSLPSVKNVNDLLDLFFNGETFHRRDKDKVAALKNIEGSIQYRLANFFYVVHTARLFHWVKTLSDVVRASDDDEKLTLMVADLRNAHGPLVQGSEPVRRKIA